MTLAGMGGFEVRHSDFRASGGGYPVGSRCATECRCAVGARHEQVSCALVDEVACGWRDLAHLAAMAQNKLPLLSKLNCKSPVPSISW